MITMMPISHQQAFKLARNHNNWAWATKMNPWYLLPPMQMDNVTPAGVYTVAEFKLQRISVKGPNTTVEETEVLVHGDIKWARGVNSDTFYYLAIERVTLSIATGLMQYYVKLSNDAEYISEPFFLFNCGDVPAAAGDYSLTDYSDDYYK